MLDYTKKQIMDFEVGTVKDAGAKTCQVFIANDTMNNGKRFAAYCYRTGNRPKNTLKWFRVFADEFPPDTDIERIFHSMSMTASGYGIV